MSEGQDKRDAEEKVSRHTAENIRSLRTARGMSQSFVTALMVQSGFDWNRTTISKIERNERNLSFAEGIALSNLLEVSPTDLINQGPEEATRRTMMNLLVSMGTLVGAAKGLLSTIQGKSAEEIMASSPIDMDASAKTQIAQSIDDLVKAARSVDTWTQTPQEGIDNLLKWIDPDGSIELDPRQHGVVISTQVGASRRFTRRELRHLENRNITHE